MFAFCIANFYMSNLRANLIAQDFEKPVELPEDVIERGQNVYIVDVSHFLFFQ